MASLGIDGNGGGDVERGILGRGVLNHLALLFDGPQQQWTLAVRRDVDET